MVEHAEGGQSSRSETSFRRLLYAGAIILYVLPLVLFGLHGSQESSHPWSGAFYGLLLGCIGVALYSRLFRLWKQELSAPPRDPSPHHSEGEEESDRIIATLEEEIRRRDSEYDRIVDERSEWESRMKEREHGWQRLQQEVEQLREERESQIAEYQTALSKQRASLESKQERINQLEARVRDLSYEIRTLLQVDELDQRGRGQPAAGASVQPDGGATPAVKRERDAVRSVQERTIRTQYDANVLLHRCIQIVQSLTGAHHLSGGSGRFRDLAVGSSTIDLRRLFERLRNEHSGVVMVFSRAENRVLFANAVTRLLFGWSPERFSKDFLHLIQGGRHEWEQALHSLSPQGETSMRLVIQSKASSDLLVHCCVGGVSRGAFQGCAVAVMYPATPVTLSAPQNPSRS